MEEGVKGEGIGFGRLSQTGVVVGGNGSDFAVQDETATTKAKKHTDKLNTHLMLKARSSNDISFLASPVTGGGVGVGRFHQLFALAIQQGKKKPEDWAVFVEQTLALQGPKTVKKGKPLETTTQQVAEQTNKPIQN